MKEIDPTTDILPGGVYIVKGEKFDPCVFVAHKKEFGSWSGRKKALPPGYPQDWIYGFISFHGIFHITSRQKVLKDEYKIYEVDDNDFSFELIELRGRIRAYLWIAEYDVGDATNIKDTENYEEVRERLKNQFLRVENPM